MGICQTKHIENQYIINLNIEKELQMEARITYIKLLLLGGGESGKSTTLKQMRIIHDGGFSIEEKKRRRFIILNSVVRNIYDMLQALATTGRILSEAAQNSANAVICYMDHGEFDDYLPVEVQAAVKMLWQEEDVKRIYQMRTNYQIEDSAKYFLDAVDRLCQTDYIPTEKDLLMLRVPTTGVVEVGFTCMRQRFRVIDVGGQRAERRKWIHCFDDVHAIIFITSLCEYDQMTREDNKTNRIHESMRLFKWISRHECFMTTSIILFLNKCDLFKEKIAAVNLNVAFRDYDGLPNDYNSGILFISNKFVRLNRNPKKIIYVHVTCATDTEQVQVVLDSTFDTIITKNMHKSGLL